MNKKISILTALAVVVFVIGVYFTGLVNQKNEEYAATSFLSGVKMTMYKSPTCGCCTKYVDELKELGVDVEVIVKEDMGSVKDEYGIPQDMRSCHTLEVGDYVVEGHMPVEAIEKLLTEMPDIDGIAMPGMPAGSPGMPGVKKNPFEVYQITDGESTKFVTV